MAEYIDREKLRQKMYQEAFVKDSDLQRWDSGCWIRYKLFENVLEKTEVADVQPVKHGRWINICGDRESMRQCSECLQDFDYIDGICYLVSGQRLPLYCPNCGADMRGTDDV